MAEPAATSSEGAHENGHVSEAPADGDVVVWDAGVLQTLPKKYSSLIRLLLNNAR